MAMSRVFHRVAFHKLVVIVDLNLIKRVKCIIVTLVITTTNKVQLLCHWVLNTLEIMWEAAIVVWLHLDGLYSLVT